MQNPAMQDRLQWVVEMRRKFSPPSMLLEDGSINQNFFRPRIEVVLTKEQRQQEEANWL